MRHLKQDLDQSVAKIKVGQYKQTLLIEAQAAKLGSKTVKDSRREGKRIVLTVFMYIST